MSAQTLIRPGQRLQAQNGGSYLLGPGTHTDPIHLPGGLAGVTIEWADGALLDAGRAEFGLRAEDGCSGLTLLRPRITNAGHGMRITFCARLRVTGGELFGNGVEGFHVAGCPGARLTGGRCHHNGAFAFMQYSRDQGHGGYLADDCSEAVVADWEFSDNAGSGLQANAASAGTVMRRLEVSRVVLARNGAGGGGTPAISLMSVRESLFSLLRFDHNAHGCVTCFADEQGEEFACFDNQFDNFSVVGAPAWTLRELEGSARNVWAPGSGWQPGAPPAPAPTDLVTLALTKIAAAKTDGELLSEIRASEIRALAAELKRLRGAA